MMEAPDTLVTGFAQKFNDLLVVAVPGMVYFVNDDFYRRTDNRRSAMAFLAALEMTEHGACELIEKAINCAFPEPVPPAESFHSSSMR